MPSFKLTIGVEVDVDNVMDPTTSLNVINNRIYDKCIARDDVEFDGMGFTNGQCEFGFTVVAVELADALSVVVECIRNSNIGGV
jgi:hypothetical protein